MSLTVSLRQVAVAALTISCTALVLSCSDDDANPTDDAGRGDSGPRSDSGSVVDGGEPVGITITVDSTLKPAQATIAAADETAPDRAVARFVGQSGQETDLVLNELIVVTSERTKLDAILDRWDGKIVATADAEAAGLSDVPPIYHVQIDPSAADAGELLLDLSSRVPEAVGSFRVSEPAALDLLAVALTEAEREGITVSPNWILVGLGIPEGNTIEAPAGDSGFVNNAFALPYMDRGSAQDIGVGAAWQAMTAAGMMDKRVKLMVWDGGFAPNDDFPESRAIYGTRYGTANAGSCGGGSCPWHGTMVVTAAVGKPDNRYGAVGPAGPIGEVVMLGSPASAADWVMALMGGFATTLAGVTAERPRIINMSFGFGMDFGWEVLSALFGPPLGVVMSGFTSAVYAAGTLIFASAGNAGIDVDANDGTVNGVLQVPCELARVICVGGMGHAVATRAANSNFGSRADEDSVDIYGPYSVWVGSTPADPANVATLVNGTSFSAPFVAGVAALTWAAKPSLTPNEVWTMLRETAHVGDIGGTGHQRRVNAFGAVQRALGGNVPPYIRINLPTEGQTFNWRANVSMTASTYDVDDGTPTITWTSSRDGALGTGASLNVSTLTVGAHTLTATATAGGASSTDTVSIAVQNNAPTVTIREPLSGATFCTTEDISFIADVGDLNNPEGFPFPSGGVVWSSTPAGLTGSGFNVTSTLAAGSYTGSVRATDEHGAFADATVPFSVSVCTDDAPVVVITSPADAVGTGPDAEYTPNTNDANGYYQSVTLTGSATDTEDGALSGAALVWTTNKADAQPGGPATGSQQLGTGTSVTVNLYTSCTGAYFGTVDHTITLTATDSGANVRQVSRIIRVITLC